MVPKVLRTLSENMTNHTRNILWSSKCVGNLSAFARSSIVHSSICLLRIKNISTKRARHNLRRSATRSAKKERKWKRGMEGERTSLGVACSQPRENSRRFQKNFFSILGPVIRARPRRPLPMRNKLLHHFKISSFENEAANDPAVRGRPPTELNRKS